MPVNHEPRCMRLNLVGWFPPSFINPPVYCSLCALNIGQNAEKSPVPWNSGKKKGQLPKLKEMLEINDAKI